MTPDLSTLTERINFGTWLTQNHITGEGVEVGVQTGENAENIIRQWPGKVHLVDSWKLWPEEEYVDCTNQIDFAKAYAETVERMSKFDRERYKIHRLTSDEAYMQFRIDGKKFAWVYLDANHALPQFGQDIFNYWKLLTSGSVFGGHDYEYRNEPHYHCHVKPVVDEFVAEHNLQLHVTAEETPSWYVIKP